MTLRIERDPTFWAHIASHPAVAGALMGLSPEIIGQLAVMPEVLPLAAEHGGFLFVKADILGFVADLHSLFTPEGWGREVHAAGIEALNVFWNYGFQALNTFELMGNRKSRPPSSFGFARCAHWRETPIGTLRLWTLTRAAWDASTAKGRDAKCLSL